MEMCFVLSATLLSLMLLLTFNALLLDLPLQQFCFSSLSHDIFLTPKKFKVDLWTVFVFFLRFVCVCVCLCNVF